MSGSAAAQADEHRIFGSSRVRAAWRRHDRTCDPGEEIARPGEGAALVIVRQGWACRARVLADGRRQIVELLLPGDHHIVGGTTPPAGEMLTAMTPCGLTRVPLSEVRASLREDGDLRLALNAARERRRAIQDERIVTLGVRTATQRMAHLFCEVLVRLGVQPPGACRTPLTQGDIGEILGMSGVHAHRTCNRLHRLGAAQLRRGDLIVRDFDALAALAGFSPGYLAWPQGDDAAVDG